jgi:hypothetical protein
VRMSAHTVWLRWLKPAAIVLVFVWVFTLATSPLYEVAVDVSRATPTAVVTALTAATGAQDGGVEFRQQAALQLCLHHGEGLSDCHVLR